MINVRSGNPDKAAALIDFLVQPATQKALKLTASAVIGAEPAQAELPLSYQWAQGPGKQPFYTIQDQAFPKKEADQCLVSAAKASGWVGCRSGARNAFEQAGRGDRPDGSQPDVVTDPGRRPCAAATWGARTGGTGRRDGTG